MEDTLWDYDELAYLDDYYVLILVVMEDTLWVQMISYNAFDIIES